MTIEAQPKQDRIPAWAWGVLGALAYAFQAARERKTWLPRLLKLYGIGAAALPPEIGQLESLQELWPGANPLAVDLSPEMYQFRIEMSDTTPYEE